MVMVRSTQLCVGNGTNYTATFSIITAWLFQEPSFKPAVVSYKSPDSH